MAFVYALDATIPAGSEAASLGDDRIREFKNAMIERLQQLVVDYTTDPYRISLVGGTVTASAPMFTATQTWNNGAVEFIALKVNITNTASLAISKLIDLQLASTSVFHVTRAGRIASVSASDPGLLISSSGQAADAKNWVIQRVSGGTGLAFYTVNDALTVFTSALEVDRSGNWITQGDIRSNAGFLRNGSMATTNATAPTLCLSNTTAPSGNPTGGGFLFSEAGASKWRGSSGTVTTLAPA